MIERLIAALQTFAVATGWWGAVAAGFAPEIFPPLASSIVAMGLGFVLFAGSPVTLSTLWKLFIDVGIPVSIGLTVGAVSVYFIVRKLGIVVVDRWGAWLGVTRVDIERFEARLRATSADETLLFAARSFPLMPSVTVNVAAALLNVPLRSFITITFLGTVIRTMASAFIGWQLGDAFERFTAFVSHSDTVIVAILVIAAAAFVWHRHRAAKPQG